MFEQLLRKQTHDTVCVPVEDDPQVQELSAALAAANGELKIATENDDKIHRMLHPLDQSATYTPPDYTSTSKLLAAASAEEAKRLRQLAQATVNEFDDAILKARAVAKAALDRNYIEGERRQLIAELFDALEPCFVLAQRLSARDQAHVAMGGTRPETLAVQLLEGRELAHQRDTCLDGAIT